MKKFAVPTSIHQRQGEGQLLLHQIPGSPILCATGAISTAVIYL